MAEEVLLLAVRDQLRECLLLDDAACEVMADGRPAPRAGELFVAVHEGEWRPDTSQGQTDLALHETLGVLVTVTLRVGMAPFDRIGTDVLARHRQGLLAWCRKALLAVHMREEIRQAANEALAGTAGYHHPLEWRDGGATQARGAEWFQARGKGGAAPCGLSRTLTFGGAARSQVLESAA